MKKILAILFLLPALVWSQTLVNPATQIRWPSVTGSGAPTSGCPVTTTATVTSGSSTVVVASTTGLFPGETVTGVGIPTNTTVSSVYGSAVVLNANATVGGTGVALNFYPYGLPYTDVVNNRQYVCSSSGWITGGSISSLTTTGTSGASTLSNGVLNIPQYAGAGANSDIISLTGLTTPLSVAQGGTGATGGTGYLYGNGGAPSTYSPTIPYSALTGTPPTWNQNTTGNAATATNLAAYPTLCSGGQFSQGLSSGSNNCATPSGSGTMTDGPGTTTAGYFPISTTTAHTYSIDTNLQDISNTLTYLGTGGITSTNGPIKASSAQLGLAGAATLLNVTGQLVSSLPASGNTANDYRLVTDGTTQADCSTGGGTTEHWCYWTGSAWISAASSALADPGANGIVKRTALNTTAPAVAGTDYMSPTTPVTNAQMPTLNVVVDTSTPVTVSTTLASEAHFNENATAATAVTYDLPTAAAGKQFCFANANNGTAANTGALTIQTSATGQYIVFTDGTLSASGGYVVSAGAARDSACVMGVSSTQWMLYVGSGTWAKH